jgi:hypothetical protein
MTEPYRSPLLDLPGAVAADGVDAGVAAHYGSFVHEQRRLVGADGFVDLSHREAFVVSGADRLTFLHSLTTQDFDHLDSGVPTSALVLSPQGHVEHHFFGSDNGESFVGHTEPGRAEELVSFLDSMRFMMRVEVRREPDLAVFWRPRSAADAVFDLVPRVDVLRYAESAGEPCGLWAYDALRIARGEPRLGFDTDARTIPNEVGWIGTAVHLQKGCYRGQETVARVHTLGRPPRRLTLLHLDGSMNRLPAVGAELVSQGKAVGFVGSSARHHELGPIALGIVKRNVPVDEQLDADGIPASQEILVDPEVGLHVRPRLG